MRKNVAGQFIAAQLISKTDGSSVTSGTCTVYVTKDGGTQASGGGTVTHEGNGEWSYAPTQAETNANHVAFTWTHTSAVAVTMNTYPVAYDPSDAAGLGLSRLDAAVSTRSTYAGGDTAGTTTLLTRVVGTVAAGTHNPQSGDAYARLGAPAGASTAADIAAVNAKTTNLPASPASTTNITAGTITTVTNLTNAPTAGDLTATMKTSVTTAATAATPALSAGGVTAVQSGLATSASIAALNNLSAAQVNAEVVDALNVDTYAEPGQGAPAATASIAAKINYLYKAWRNRKTQTATTFVIYADNETTVDHKATTSDDGTTFSQSEIVTGP